MPSEFLFDTNVQTALSALNYPVSDSEKNSDISPASDSVEPRSYIEVRPSKTALEPNTITRAMDLLFTLLRNTTKTGFRHKLTGSVERPLVEWLLVSDGRKDASIRYLVGTTHDDLLEDLEGILRTCFPDTYELHSVEWHPRHIEEHLSKERTGTRPADANDQTSPQHPEITPTQPYIAGVEYRGRAKRCRDWQTPFTTFAEFTDTNNTQSRSRHETNERDSRRVPLASLVEAIQDAEVPTIYQAVCRPYGNQTAGADEYLYDLERELGSADAKILDMLTSTSENDRRAHEPTSTDQARIDGIEERTLQRTFCVSARAVALTDETPRQADAVARRLARTLGHLSGDYHEIIGDVITDDELHPATKNPPGMQIFTDLCERTIYPGSYEAFQTYLPRVPHEIKGIVVAPEELLSSWRKRTHAEWSTSNRNENS